MELKGSASRIFWSCSNQMGNDVYLFMTKWQALDDIIYRYNVYNAYLFWFKCKSIRCKYISWHEHIPLSLSLFLFQSLTSFWQFYEEALFTVWTRGMILVPLDPHDPLVRLRHVLSEAKASCCVTKDWGDAKTLGTGRGTNFTQMGTLVAKLHPQESNQPLN